MIALRAADGSPLATESLFTAHVTDVARRTCGALERVTPKCDTLVIHTGTQRYYPSDDQALPFRPWPHFARLAPVAGPDHLIVVQRGSRPRLIRVVPQDYWEEPPQSPDHPYPAALDVIEVSSPEAASKALRSAAPTGSRCAFIGPDPAVAAALEIPPERANPASLIAALDWERGAKTEYEVACIRSAGRRAARGHAAARAAAEQGESERRIHGAYLDATEQLDAETPYGNIVAWDDRAAVLHYQRRRLTRPDPGHTFLIDAGATCFGYASDVTRTYASASAPAPFRAALDGMDTLQRELVAAVAPGVDFVDLHARALRGVAALLREIGVVRCSVDDALERGIALPFLPHGLGHHLGLQVHDVGGRQIDPEGTSRPTPAAHPYLRTTRILAPGHVVTVEPGVYFIPLLLAPIRSGPHSDAIDWRLVDTLIPCGGIRIEDDVHVTAAGFEDLTRPLVPGHRAA